MFLLKHGLVNFFFKWIRSSNQHVEHITEQDWLTIKCKKISNYQCRV